MLLQVIFGAFLLADKTLGKIYDRCELAQELKYVHKAPSHQLATWVCIAEHESQYNTSIVGHLNGDGSGDHGIFQISDKYWCSPPGKGLACGLTCGELEDDDISDDFICAQTIYKEHKQVSGDGFNAWAVYQPYCKGAKADRYIKDCFSDAKESTTFSTPGPLFAHGFFSTSDERRNKIFSTSTQKPAFEAFSNFGSSSTVENEKLSFLTGKPSANLLSTPKPSFVTNRFFPLNQNSYIDLFFTSRTTTFKPITSTTTAFSTTTTRPQTSNAIIFDPITSTPASINPYISTSSIIDFKQTFSSPSSKFYYTPSVSTPLSQTSTVSYPPPIFIINGVMWH